MIPDMFLAAVLHFGERHTQPTDASIIATAAKVPGRWQSFARCVIRRESGGSLDRPQSGAGARNSHSSAQGRWQFLRQWQYPLGYMVADRLKAKGMTKANAKAIRFRLQHSEIATWPGQLQDVAFVAVVTAGGAHHWRLPGSPCEALR